MIILAFILKPDPSGSDKRMRAVDTMPSPIGIEGQLTLVLRYLLGCRPGCLIDPVGICQGGGGMLVPRTDKGLIQLAIFLHK